MKNISIIFIAITIQLLPGSNLYAQSGAIDNYENLFFMLDFENEKYDLADVEEYFFTTFPHNDPTWGDVVYDRSQWLNGDMITLLDYDGLYGYVKFRDDEMGFDSFRFTTKPFYNLNDDVKSILFVYKGSFPSAQGVWPAWWLNGSRQDEWLYKHNTDIVTDDMLDRYSGNGEFHNTPSPVNSTDWPSAGEIDIIETINGDNIIHNTIHTCPQMCDSEWNNDGIIINCANATESDPNAGCSGNPFNVKEPAGTFACLWEKNSIRFYYWEPGEDVRSGNGPLSDSPNPQEWDTNLMNHVRFIETDTECDDDKYQEWQCENCDGKNTCSFVNLKMIFNVTLCGKWAGGNFDETDNPVDNCREYILNEGMESIHNTYMKIEYVSVKGLLK